MKPFKSYIDYNLRDSTKLYYIAMILLVASQLIHYVTPHGDERIFKILFILAYLGFIVNDIKTQGKIHIATLIGRLSIITLVAISIYVNLELLTSHKVVLGGATCYCK